MAVLGQNEPVMGCFQLDSWEHRWAKTYIWVLHCQASVFTSYELLPIELKEKNHGWNQNTVTFIIENANENGIRKNGGLFIHVSICQLSMCKSFIQHTDLNTALQRIYLWDNQIGCDICVRLESVRTTSSWNGSSMYSKLICEVKIFYLRKTASTNQKFLYNFYRVLSSGFRQID